MYKYKNDIYDLCSSTAVKALEAFCHEINTSEADVFVIMAHKAVRLFQILHDQKHISSHIATKIVISSHALDFDSSYLLGKKVAIIDDILISGTSIASTVHKLLGIGVTKNNISIVTLAIDKRYQSMSFNDETGHSLLHCKTYLEDSTCIELSYTISKIFSCYGMPYDVDYPNYAAIDLDSEKINLLFNNFLWDTNRISNEKQKSGNIDSFILFPNECVRQLLWKHIGIDLEKVVHLKIRVYVNNFPSGKKECFVVPMCLFDEISEKDIDTLYSLCSPKTKEIILHNDMFVSKMRYLQFYIAHQLYIVFKDITSLSNNAKPTEDSIKILFGTVVGAIISSEINTTCENNRSSVFIDNLDLIDKTILKDFFNSKTGKQYIEKAKQIKQYEINNKNFELNHIILMPFLWWYDTKELPVRNDLVNNQNHFIENYEDIEIKLKRLNSGFSLKILKSILQYTLDDYEADHLISLFIDRAIDEGIIVPTICHADKGAFLYRAYRHGEDLPFGLQDECRLLYFLECLGKKIPNISTPSCNTNSIEGMATISFEKMIVLFYQMGLEEGDIFNRFLGFNNVKLLKPFLSMHGTVEGFVDPKYIEKNTIVEHFYSESLENGDKYITWLTHWLYQNKFIIKTEDKTCGKHDRIVYFIDCTAIDNFLKQNERNCISSVIQENISNIADMLSTWYLSMSKTEGKDKFKEDAIALTSCSNSFVYASAIATEIHYFSKFWRNQAKNSLEYANDATMLLNKLVETEEDKEQTSNAEQALYSGRNKVGLYNSHRATEVVEKVANILSSNGATIWAELWDAVKSGEYSASKELDVYTNQVIGFLYFYSACYECLRFNSFWAEGNKPPQYDKYRELYEVQCQRCYLLNKELFDRIDEISNLTKFATKKARFNKFVNNVIKDSEDSVRNIEIQIESGVSNYTIRYKSSLVFEVNSFDPTENDRIVMNIWNQLEENIDKTQINIVKFPSNICRAGFMCYGIFYGNSSNKKYSEPTKNATILIDLYQKLCSAFNGKVYEIKAIMIPDTPPGRMFKHNVQRNITQYVTEFSVNIVDCVKEHFNRNVKQQMIVGLTDFVDHHFDNVLKGMNWDKCSIIKKQDSQSLFSKIISCYNNYISPEFIDKKDISYSIVRVSCGNSVGVGVLLKTCTKLICVSCNHLLLSYKKNEPHALSDYKEEVTFKLKPIKDIVIPEDKRTVLSAEDEVAVLDVDWNGRIPFDMEKILSLDDLTYNIMDYSNVDCQCCGYPEDSLLWSDPLKIMGSANKGYYQTRIETGEYPAENGYSGGLVVPVDNTTCILGMHEGRYNKCRGRMIPCETIKKVINKEITKCEKAAN